MLEGWHPLTAVVASVLAGAAALRLGVDCMD